MLRLCRPGLDSDAGRGMRGAKKTREKSFLGPYVAPPPAPHPASSRPPPPPPHRSPEGNGERNEWPKRNLETKWIVRATKFGNKESRMRKKDRNLCRSGARPRQVTLRFYSLRGKLCHAVLRPELPSCTSMENKDGRRKCEGLHSG